MFGPYLVSKVHSFTYALPEGATEKQALFRALHNIEEHIAKKDAIDYRK